MEKYISVTKVLSVFFMLFLIGCNANSNTYHEITSKIDEEKTKKIAFLQQKMKLIIHQFRHLKHQRKSFRAI